eukprot:288445-Prorocentrum_minimum.AAC.1
MSAPRRNERAWSGNKRTRAGEADPGAGCQGVQARAQQFRLCGAQRQGESGAAHAFRQRLNQGAHSSESVD